MLFSSGNQLLFGIVERERDRDRFYSSRVRAQALIFSHSFTLSADGYDSPPGISHYSREREIEVIKN